jgi:hypothetical protein
MFMSPRLAAFGFSSPIETKARQPSAAQSRPFEMPLIATRSNFLCANGRNLRQGSVLALYS